MNKTKKLCIMALGIALYVCVSLMLKIPIGVGHLSLDLGYLVLAVYCYIYGGISGAIVGACGCFMVSLIGSAWIAVGWPIGNFVIGLLCGVVYKKMKNVKYGVIISIITTIIVVFIGIAVIKTSVDCVLYSTPFTVKFIKNTIAFTLDATVMSVGVVFAKLITRNLPKNIKEN